MAWDVEVNHYMNLAVVTLWGCVAVAEREQALDAILGRMEPGRDYRVLVDMIGAQPALDCPDAIEAFAQRLAVTTRLRGWRLAYLYPAGSRAHRLVEQLACAPDFPFRRFHAVIEAMDWLLAPAPRLSLRSSGENRTAPDWRDVPLHAARQANSRGRPRKWFG